MNSQAVAVSILHPFHNRHPIRVYESNFRFITNDSLTYYVINYRTMLVGLQCIEVPGGV